jgi:hypothetical protein
MRPDDSAAKATAPPGSTTSFVTGGVTHGLQRCAVGHRNATREQLAIDLEGQLTGFGRQDGVAYRIVPRLFLT